MKFLFEQPTYSLYNHQERIDCFPDNSSNSFIFILRCSIGRYLANPLTIETIQSVLENRYFSTDILKRMEIYSLASDEQSNSYNYQNTYLYSEESSQFDDCSSLTTITSNLPKECNPVDLDDHS